MVHEPTGDWCSAAAQDSGSKRMRVADQSLGLERRQNGAIEGIGEGDDIGDATAGAVTCVFRTILNTDSDPS